MSTQSTVHFYLNWGQRADRPDESGAGSLGAERWPPSSSRSRGTQREMALDMAKGWIDLAINIESIEALIQFPN
jgi:hypothetical protein